jgi:hypothetical protein
VAHKGVGESRRTEDVGRGWMPEGAVTVLRYRVFRVRLVLIFGKIQH